MAAASGMGRCRHVLRMPTTLNDLLQQAHTRLQGAALSYGHGTQNARDEAAWLLLWRLGLPLDTDLEAEGARPVSDTEAAAVRELIERRIATRQPAAYLTGEAWLHGMAFDADARAIVPRSFIAELLVAHPAADCLDDWLGVHTQRVLDMCTGNGSLAVLAALAWPEVTLDGSDISAPALQLAQRNLERHGLQQRVRLLQSDGWSGIADRYDLILCNPPYVSRAAMQALPPEYRAEPALALDGGHLGSADGMDFVRHLLAHALEHLEPEGVLVLEIGHERAHFERAFPGLCVQWLRTSAWPLTPVLLLTHEALDGWQAATPAACGGPPP